MEVAVNAFPGSGWHVVDRLTDAIELSVDAFLLHESPHTIYYEGRETWCIFYP
jgi:hypothetical protein